ncbi:hypothetical protein LX32DRAFT_186742 [Colletotrichum zoysiae]|uniref:Uncharacterized protein n=1 Tax=Colletotrichum zoysiae TaxID=1216348 RepID=A0AAD9H5F3_9PEZI|nr:hypothetical protein LX32DRAFT_186742 [Colletotrichum zoysiae]
MNTSSRPHSAKEDSATEGEKKHRQPAPVQIKIKSPPADPQHLVRPSAGPVPKRSSATHVTVALDSLALSNCHAASQPASQPMPSAQRQRHHCRYPYTLRIRSNAYCVNPQVLQPHQPLSHPPVDGGCFFLGGMVSKWPWDMQSPADGQTPILSDPSTT